MVKITKINLEDFTTQKSLVTAKALLGMAMFSLLQKHNYLDEFIVTVDGIEKSMYRPVRGFRKAFKIVRPYIESALTGSMTYLKNTFPTAYRCIKDVRKVRRLLSELGCFGICLRKGELLGFDENGGKIIRNPPAMLIDIDLPQCLRVFQSLTIKLEAMQAEALEHDRKVLDIPNHDFAFCWDLFRAYFRVGMKTKLPKTQDAQDEIFDPLEQDDTEALEEKAKDNNHDEIAIARMNKEAIDGELANAYALKEPQPLIERLLRRFAQAEERLEILRARAHPKPLNT